MRLLVLALSMAAWLMGCQHAPVAGSDQASPPETQASAPVTTPAAASAPQATASTPATSSTADAPAAEPAITPRRWEGRMSVKLDAHLDQAAEGISFAFDLQTLGDQGELALSTPLGTQIARIRWTPQEAILSNAEGTQTYPDLETLSIALLGEALPLHALTHWLDGRPAADRPHQPLAATQGFEQDGWQIDLSGFERDLLVARRPASTAARGITLRARLMR